MRKSDYQPLGKYIEQVNVRNRDLTVTNLMGVSIEKRFIPSIANTIGTDLSPYKIVKPGQFAYGPVTSRNGDKITIALYNGNEDCIISQAYEAFRIKDTTQLLPEYLMMWAKRPEFDRYARYMSHGSVRELFSWEEMCNVMLPVPPIGEQRRIVSEYQTVERRSANNEALIPKLEETAQAIYHHTFVEGIDEENLPEGWRKGCLEEVTICFDSKRKPVAGYDRTGKKSIYPYYGATSIMDYVDDYIFDGEYILMGEDGSVVTEDGKPYLQYLRGKIWVNNHAHILQGKGLYNNNILYWSLNNTIIQNYITGAVQLKLNQQNMNSIPVIIPDENTLIKIQKILNPITDYIYCLNKDIGLLKKLLSLLTSKLS